MDSTQLFLSASVRGWSIGGGWGRESNHDVSTRISKKGQRRSNSVNFFSVLTGEVIGQMKGEGHFLYSVQTSLR